MVAGETIKGQLGNYKRWTWRRTPQWIVNGDNEKIRRIMYVHR